MSEKNSDFDLQEFRSPGISFSPIYSWVWNDKCSIAIIDEQLAEMQRLGIRAFYIIPEPKEFRPYNMPTDLEPDYLSSDYLNLYAYAMEKSKEMGMYCWLYDEGGWPSGGACGQVLRDHPEYAKEVLCWTDTIIPTDSPYVKGSSDILGAFLMDGTPVEEGIVFPQDTAVTEYFTTLVNNGGSDYPDLLNRNATEYFLNITHDRYASSLQSAMGQTVTAVFTDEPKAPGGAFRRDLAERYVLEYGESVLPHLPLIAGKIPITKENIHVLYRWYDLLSRTFCENFLLPCKNWASIRGMAFTGHMDVDHDPAGCMRGCNYHLMRALRCLDIPGVDVIWRQIYPESESYGSTERQGYNGFFPRYASSAAAQTGSDLAMTESFGVFGPGLTFDTMRYCLGYQAVRGINIFNPMSISLGRKNAQLAQELPSFTEDQIYYCDLPLFNRYLERLSYLSSLGERVYDTALYYPVHDFWGQINRDSASDAFDAMGRALEARQVDFDIVDSDVIENAEGADEGCLRIGKAVYRHLVIQENVHLPERTLRTIERFVKAGGTVSHTVETAVRTVYTGLPESVAQGLRAMRRRTEKAELLCLFRESGDTGEYDIHVPAGNVYRLSAEDGDIWELTPKNGVVRVALAVGESAFLLVTKELLPARKEPLYEKALTLPDSFRFCRTLGLTYGADRLENVEYREEAEPLPLGDWSTRAGKDYSGSGIYVTTFRLDSCDAGRFGAMYLGDVHYTASIKLNGMPLGTVLMPPYQVFIPKGLLKEENTLEIAVTNTPANQFVHTDFFSKWEPRELSTYYERERMFAEDSTTGGLYGPVKLFLASN